MKKIIVGVLVLGCFALPPCWAESATVEEVPPVGAAATERGGEEEPGESTPEEPQGSPEGVFRIPNSEATIGMIMIPTTMAPLAALKIPVPGKTVRMNGVTKVSAK